MKILDYIKNKFSKRYCVRCGEVIKGEAECVNVFDRIVGYGKGIKHDKCNLKIGSPMWIRNYWINHALHVILNPDYFGRSAYQEAIRSYRENVGQENDKRLEEIIKFINKKYPNNWDK